VSKDAGLSRAVRHILEFHGIAPAVCVADLKDATAHIVGSICAAVRPRAIVLDQDSMWIDHESFFDAVRRTGLGSTCRLIVLGGDEEQRDAATYSQAFRTTRFTSKPPTSRELIPLLNADPTTAGPANRTLSTATRALVGCRERVKVILADDNRINRQLARIFLDHLGVQVDEAKTGAEVLELSRKGPYDIILMDIHMPDIDGLAATRTLRADANNPNRRTPVIALTADAMAQQHKRYIGSGVNDHLCKPITEGALQQLLGKWCPVQPSANTSFLVESSRANLDA
jgi:CheY-like chemotaxis protein